MPESATAAPKAEPFSASIMQIEPQWIDYNGHLNMAYYNVMFDRAIDEFWLELGIGPTYKKERHGSTFTAECHVRYLREIHLGDPVRILVWLLEADDKRLHTFEEMRHATEGWLSATSREHVAAHGHECAARCGVSARYPAAHRGHRQGPQHLGPARGHRPERGDALEALGAYILVRPRARPTTAETRNSTTAMKKMILAISIEAPAMPPKPRIPAISAITRNVTTQPSMVKSSS
ncbi:acyl-CoA thioesterase FadM [Bradyrhizobium diazoefficiens]